MTIRKGKRTPHPSHVKGAEGEKEKAHFIHALPNEVVLFWGQKIGAHGADVVSYNLKTKIVTLWDVKWRSRPVRVQPSRTFVEKSRREYAMDQAVRAIRTSRLPRKHKAAAERSILKGTFHTRTIGAGRAKDPNLGQPQ